MELLKAKLLYRHPDTHNENLNMLVLYYRGFKFLKEVDRCDGCMRHLKEKNRDMLVFVA